MSLLGTHTSCTVCVIARISVDVDLAKFGSDVLITAPAVVRVTKSLRGGVVVVPLNSRDA